VNLLGALQNVDRRYLYALLLFTVALPFFISAEIPVPVQPSTKALYDTIDKLPERSFVLLSMDWGPGTRGENRAQAIALLKHLMRKNLRFAMISFEPSSKTLAEALARDEAADTSTHRKYEYGVDWVNFGYRADQDDYIKGFVHNIPGTVGEDIHGAPVASMKVLEGVHSAQDIAMLLDVTPSDTYNSYVKFVQGPYQIPFGVALTAVMAPEGYNRLDSHQVVGLMAGLQGAVEYEQKLGYAGRANRASLSSSAAHFLIIGLILMGNVAMLLDKRKRKQGGAQ
jgi:hypothetical protein